MKRSKREISAASEARSVTFTQKQASNFIPLLCRLEVGIMLMPAAGDCHFVRCFCPLRHAINMYKFFLSVVFSSDSVVQLSLSQLATTSRYPTMSHTVGSPWQQQIPSLLSPSPMASAHQLSHVVSFPPTYAHTRAHRH